LLEKLTISEKYWWEEGYFKLPRPFPSTDRFLEVQDGFVKCYIKEGEHTGYVAYVSVKTIVTKFNQAETLREFKSTFNLSSRGVFNLLSKLNLDPWPKIVADYSEYQDLNIVAARHAMRPDTLSKNLKRRGVAVPKGRKRIDPDPDVLSAAIAKHTTTAGLARELEISRAKARKLKQDSEM